MLDGIAISGYRSFGEGIQYISPLGKINLFIGQNNCGKSNILRLLVDHMVDYLKSFNHISALGNKIRFSDIDYYKGVQSIPILVGFAVDINKHDILKKITDTVNYQQDKDVINKIFTSIFLTKNDGLFWLILDTKYEIEEKIIDEIISENIVTPNEWKGLALSLTRTSSSNYENIRILLHRFFDNAYDIPPIYFVPAKRKIDNSTTNEFDLSGKGLIEKLAKLQTPDYAEQNLKEDFKMINEFLRSVTGNEDATIEIPYTHDKINVIMDGKVLPLESLGTGIHEVIILASAATIVKDSVICMEEPEIHLHPLLQKKLISYLHEKTSNQYFIATHSPHFLDSANCNIFHVKNDGKASTVTYVKTDDSVFEICSDLGYRPSDLLQTNSIIWVEGPSDRIYINYWLKSLDKELIEGIHYSTMFYGGKLLKHLTANDNQIDDFISLTRLNRNSIIVIDSDMKNEDEEINATKKRIKTEFEEHGIIVWITKGREIENYINPDVYERCVCKVHPSAIKLENKTFYSNLPKFIKKDSEEVSIASKTDVAKEVINLAVDLSILDLEERIKSIHDFILKANGIKKMTSEV